MNQVHHVNSAKKKNATKRHAVPRESFPDNANVNLREETGK